MKKPNGSLRICLDHTDLNKYIVRPVCNSRTLDDVSHQLKDAKYFSVFDATKGFFHLPLSAKSRLLTAMLTPEGVYVFNVLAMGLCNVGDLFESALRDLLSGLPGMKNIADDILVIRSTQEEHDANVIRFLERCLEIDLHLNPDKVKINCKSVPFFGIVLTADGIKPDPKKVETIKKWPIPPNVTELQSFLGSINYLSHFIPGLSQLRRPLQALIKKNSEYVWTDVHDRVFQDLKDMVSEDCLIQFYDPHKPLFIECDASKQGIGCVMLQPDDNIPTNVNNGIPSNLRPVAYASESLSGAEQNYANIERELLGVVFSLETFKHFTSGRQMNIITDHKPLTSLFSKCLANTSPRLAKMMLHISDYDANVLDQKGSKMFLSDALSCLSSHNTRQGKQSEIKGLNISVHDVERDVHETTLDKIYIHSKTDSTLSRVMHYVLNGWPGNANECAEPAQPYFTYREELTIVDGLLVKGNRIVIPTDMRQDCLETLHEPHLGLQKTLLRAHTSVFWPGMTTDIKTQISNCSACQKFQTKQPAETLRNELPTTQPWTCLATDIFEYGGKSYIIVVDWYSKFIIVCKVSDHSSEQTVATFLQIFSEFHVPDEIHSDRSQLYLSTVLVFL